MTDCRLSLLFNRWREHRIKRREDKDSNIFTSLEVLYRDKIRRLEAENRELRATIKAMKDA